MASEKNLERALSAKLDGYSDEVARAVKQAVRDTADDTAVRLRKTSPGRRYAKSWKPIVRKETSLQIVIGVQNVKHYRLTHLLEKPHKLRNGKSTRPSAGFGGKVHIAPADEEAEKELAAKIEKAIEEGRS